jgi:ketosteroid isomerase-like protein
MPRPTRSDEELDELLRRTADAASALIRGDARSYFRLVRHADDFTLMSPYGGDPIRGFDDSDEALDALAQFFRGGDARLEVVASHVSGDLAVLALIEHQRGEIDDLPEQDLSLRVQLVHRHADPLVHGIELGRLAGLVRGD